MKRSRSLFGILLVSCLASVAPSLEAAPTSQESAAAEALFEEGQSLVEKGDFPAACDRFEKSQRLDPQVGTLLYLATCHEQIGKTATAWVEFKDAQAQAESANKPERVKQAQEGVARVGALLSKATIKLEAPAEGQVVTVNGVVVKVFDTPLPYDPGTLTVEASAKGKKTHTQTVELASNAVLDVVVPKLEDAPVVSVEPPAKDHTLAYVVGGAGLGVTALGFAFGGVAMAQKGSADDGHCDATTCDQEGLDLYDQATAFAWASNVTVGVGLAAVATGVVLFFVLPGETPPSTALLPTFAPAPGGGTLGVRGAF